ncbi:hypothetical protein PUN28_003939 [Cardiocondyla obscurior]|uniref:Uncharacterized protein n=1 Tax=Cardiocondyla obscurior TaxID=286306 RepID=A0AAW2GN93_9HYME
MKEIKNLLVRFYYFNIIKKYVILCRFSYPLHRFYLYCNILLLSLTNFQHLNLSRESEKHFRFILNIKFAKLIWYFEINSFYLPLIIEGFI